MMVGVMLDIDRKFHSLITTTLANNLKKVMELLFKVMKSSYFLDHIMNLVYIWYDDRYRSKVLFSNTCPTHLAHGPKASVQVSSAVRWQLIDINCFHDFLLWKTNFNYSDFWWQISNLMSIVFFRANGPLRNLPEFAETFNCPTGSFMNPEDRCIIYWCLHVHRSRIIRCKI